MNNSDAEKILNESLIQFEQKSYTELRDFVGNSFNLEKIGNDDNSYQIEILVIWDSKMDGLIRVIGSIDDGTLSSIKPITRDFLKHPHD